jgi:beta-N-acetylhexosaminidase
MRQSRQASPTDSPSDERMVAQAAERSLTVSGDATLRGPGVDVVRIVADPGYAAGETGWGVADPLGSAGYDVSEIGVDEAEAGLGVRELVVEVRDVWKSPRLMYELAELVAHRPDAVVVDVGWPAAPLPEARGWITTRGTGRLSSALAACVLGGTDPAAAALSILMTAHLED